MTKGEHTRLLILAGHDNDYIVRETGSTLNSVRWHRSKMAKKAERKPKPVLGEVKPFVNTTTLVGDIAEAKGYVETIIEGIMFTGKTREEAEHYWERACKWRFIYGKNLGGRFGQCHYRKRHVEVHEGIKDLEYDFRETFLHEVAHVLAYLIHEKCCGHQWQWKNLMIGMKLPTSMYGRPSAAAKAVLDEIRMTKRANKKPYVVWECSCCGHEWPRYGKPKYAPSRYHHKPCGRHATFRVKEGSKPSTSLRTLS